VLFIRAQSAIRADGAPSAQVRSLQLDVWSYVARFRRSGHCALARANRVFGTDEKRIRTKNTVRVNTKQGVRVLYKIVDSARMCFSSVRYRRSARTASRPRSIATPHERRAI